VIPLNAIVIRHNFVRCRTCWPSTVRPEDRRRDRQSLPDLALHR
jgi:hypothetical protein